MLGNWVIRELGNKNFINIINSQLPNKQITQLPRHINRKKQMLNEMKSRTLTGKKKVLFLCTGNSCRSQIAEGYLRHLAGEKFEVYSAGLEPSKVNPNAIRVMDEKNIDISSHTSDDINKFIDDKFDYIITVCDNAKENCPYFTGDAKRLHWSFGDPADATGSEEEVLAVFRKVRDRIKNRIIEFCTT